MLMKSRASKSISYIYLLLVPIVTFVLAFAIGHVSYKFYLPIWLLNVSLMIMACWSLGLHVIRLKNEEESKLARTAFFLVVPWILISMFAGIGPPPHTSAEWTATAKEQQVRYFMLVICGVFAAFGFVGLRDMLKRKGENFYSLLSLAAIQIVLPLFIINMLFWGFYITELFKIHTIVNKTDFPEWFLPTYQLFVLIAITEAALTYFATFLIVLALRKLNWLSKTSSSFYILFSLLAFVLIILAAFFPAIFQVGAALAVPAFPLVMPYLIGVNLLRQVGNKL